MVKFLARLFVRDWEDIEQPQVRSRYGILAGVLGVVVNLLLCAGKLVTGFLGASVSILGDAINNLSDAASSVVTLVGFRLAGRQADEKHPFGYARAEYISGLAVAALILVIGVELVKSSVEKILHPEQIVFSWLMVAVLLVSIVMKIIMAAFNRSVGQMISSTTLEAAAADSRNDVLATLAVLIATILAETTGLILDGYMGVVVGLFILYSGIQIGRETMEPLLGKAATQELVDMVRQKTQDADSRILGIHDLMVHDYGPGCCFASLHAEIDHREDVMEAHEVIDGIERMFLEEHHIHLVIHYDPVVTDDAELNGLRAQVEARLRVLDEGISTHDFRMTHGSGVCNVIFDVVLPGDAPEKRAQAEAEIDAVLLAMGEQYHAMVTYDNQSFNR